VPVVVVDLTTLSVTRTLCRTDRMTSDSWTGWIWYEASWNNFRFYPIFFIASWVGLSPLYCGHFWPIVPAPDDRWRWLCSNW
jgi:hypothetical protein